VQQALVLLRPKRTTSPLDKGLAAQKLSQVRAVAPSPLSSELQAPESFLACQAC
jgi:hypothetical protein